MSLLFLNNFSLNLVRKRKIPINSQNKTMNVTVGTLVGASLLVTVPTSIANELTVSGFAGVGLVSSSANNFLGKDNTGNAFDFGLKLDYSFANNFSFSGQIGYREFGESIADDNIRIDYAALRYVTNSLGFGEQRMALGRVKTRVGLYNEFRDIPTSKPSLLLPQAIYLDVFRSLFLSIDGLSVATINELYNGDVSAQFSIGKINIEDNFAENGIGPFVSGSLEEDQALIFDLRYTTDKLVMAFSISSFEPLYNANVGDFVAINRLTPPIPIIDGSFTVDSVTTSFQYRWDDLELSAEYTRRSFDIKGLIPDFVPINRVRPMEGFYGQLRYPISQNISILARWERFYRNANNKSGNRETDGAQGLPKWAEISTTQTLSVHWRIDEQWHLMADYHHVNGSAFLPPFSISSSDSLESESWNIIGAQLIFRF